MVTRQQLNRLAGQIDALTDAINPDAAPVTVTVFAGETPEFAARRHCELRPEHVGRRVRFDHQPHHHRSDQGHEWCAVWAAATEADTAAFLAEWNAMQERSKNSPCHFVGMFDEKDPAGTN